MDTKAIIEEEWENCFQTMVTGEFFQRMENGTLTREHYKAFLAEEYYNTTENPKLMALFISRLDTSFHKTAGKMLKHAAMEMGHNEMALQDLKELGGDTAEVRLRKPLPATEALAAFIAYEIQHRNPKAFLGYIYHMENLSVRLAGKSGNTFSRLQIPEKALTFLREHADADPTHMRWNRDYLHDFIVSNDDRDAVVYGIRGTCLLHGLMFQGIVESVEKRGYFKQHQSHPRVAA